MNTDDTALLSGSVKGSWHRFIDLYEPLRPELYRYCRSLARSPWDAEDLVQDALARAFVTLGRLSEPPANPRAWLFRVASNLWIDRTRRAREVPGDVPERVAAGPDRQATREAAGTLVSRLSPQERAAVVLKDVFDLTLEEIADALSTTPNAVKAALHRGRGKLVDPEPAEPRAPSPRVIDAFCAAFNARDLDGLTALLVDGCTMDIVGVGVEYGPEAARRGALSGMLSLVCWNDALGCGVEPQWLEGYVPGPARAEVRDHRGEPIVVLWYPHVGGEVVRSVNRVDTDGEGLSTFHHYFFNPEIIEEVCRELDLPFRTNGYRYWRSTRATPTSTTRS